jgi:hypothetical protein
MIWLSLAATVQTIVSSTSLNQNIQTVATVAGVVAALIVGYFLFRVGRQQKRIAAMDAYLRLDARLESPTVIQARSAVSAAYLSPTNPPTATDRDKVSFVMKHFEAIGFAVRHKIIDKKMVWSWVGDPLLAYCQAFIEVIGKDHRDEPTMWEDLHWLAPRLAKINLQRGVRDWPGGYPGEPATRAIMTRESALADQIGDPEPHH